MAIKMEIISQQIIKPSSPTLTHLRNHKLSLVDQIAPPIYIPIIFFYNHDQLTLKNLSHNQISPLLKQSLSEILTTFYPLAGEIDQENLSIDCNDSGVEFIEARVHTQLSEVIQNPNMQQLKKLQPFESLKHEDNVLLKVKICFFDCDGISVAICSSHKIFDAASLVEFINAWAASCRGETLNFQPIFDFAFIFPPRDLSGLDFIDKVGMTDEKMATKRFVFNKEELTKIKNDFINESQVKNPTRVEAVSSYIWRRFMDLAKAENSTKTTSFAAIHAVNMRSRKSPPFAQHIFGNCWRSAIALSEPWARNCDLVAKTKEAITSIDNEFIRQVENGEHVNLVSRSVDFLMKGGVELYFFTSWFRFPVYEVDFGWGKPVWVCTTTVPMKNFVILMSTPCGEGIEAWVNMLEEDLKMFEPIKSNL